MDLIVAILSTVILWTKYFSHGVTDEKGREVGSTVKVEELEIEIDSHIEPKFSDVRFALNRGGRTRKLVAWEASPRVSWRHFDTGNAVATVYVVTIQPSRDRIEFGASRTGFLISNRDAVDRLVEKKVGEARRRSLNNAKFEVVSRPIQDATDAGILPSFLRGNAFSFRDRVAELLGLQSFANECLLERISDVLQAERDASRKLAALQAEKKDILDKACDFRREVTSRLGLSYSADDERIFGDIDRRSVAISKAADDLASVGAKLRAARAENAELAGELAEARNDLRNARAQVTTLVQTLRDVRREGRGEEPIGRPTTFEEMEEFHNRG